MSPHWGRLGDREARQCIVLVDITDENPQQYWTHFLSASGSVLKPFSLSPFLTYRDHEESAETILSYVRRPPCPYRLVYPWDYLGNGAHPETRHPKAQAIE